MRNYTRSIILCFILIILLLTPIHAQEEIAIISPNVFVRGIEKENGVLYTASFIKPDEDMSLRNISVEITIPADAQFTEMLVSKQVQFDVIRRNRQGELTLIWQISRVEADTPLDSFSFTLAESLSTELEFYMLWQNEQGQNFLENFFELPSIVTATATDATFTPTSEAFSFVGNTGIQIASPFNKPLSFHLLANDFNPPAEYGAVWWCSLLQLDGLAEGESVVVIVPLRRPVAPFIELVLFQQQNDGTWLPLEETGVVTADGQYVIYRHTGGLIATGGDEEIRQDVVPLAEVEIEIVEQTRPEPPVNNNPQPPANIVIETNSNLAPIPLPPVNNPVPVNTAVPVLNTVVPNTAIPNTTVPVPPTEDGRSNTIVLVEVTATTDNAVRDGTSNTVIVGEASPETPQFQSATRAPIVTATLVVAEATVANPGDSESTEETTSLAEITATESVFTPTEDGRSNTIVLVEVTATNDNAVRDGTSNTVIVGEASPETPQFQSATGTPIDLSTSSLTPTLTATALPVEATVITATASPQPILLTQTDVSDIVVPSSTTPVAIMTSNPISLSTANETPIVQLVTETPTPVSTITPVIIATPSLFGSGGTRIVIFITEDGEVIQCQVGSIQCAIIKRIDASEE